MSEQDSINRDLESGLSKLEQPKYSEQITKSVMTQVILIHQRVIEVRNKRLTILSLLLGIGILASVLALLYRSVNSPGYYEALVMGIDWVKSNALLLVTTTKGRVFIVLVTIQALLIRAGIVSFIIRKTSANEL